jgi:hypothetical protein
MENRLSTDQDIQPDSNQIKIKEKYQPKLILTDWFISVSRGLHVKPCVGIYPGVSPKRNNERDIRG